MIVTPRRHERPYGDLSATAGVRARCGLPSGWGGGRLPAFGSLTTGACLGPRDADEVVAAARHAASASSAFTAADLAEAMKRRLAPAGPQLSPREAQVPRLLADGMSVAGIAKRLYVSKSTAKTHISKLYEKLGAVNRAQALMTALRLGLFEALS